MRQYSRIDPLLGGINRALITLWGRPAGTGRDDPAAPHPEAELTARERRHVEGLMRVDHAGEVSAQALYQGQALTARSESAQQALERSAEEENDHLLWTEHRLRDVRGRKSALNPVWYSGSFAIGAVAGLFGDRVNLGFVAETEDQVGAHLDRHLDRLPSADRRSRAVLEQMREDELNHAAKARENGGTRLPLPARLGMRAVSRVMTTLAYRL